MLNNKLKMELQIRFANKGNYGRMYTSSGI